MLQTDLNHSKDAHRAAQNPTAHDTDLPARMLSALSETIEHLPPPHRARARMAAAFLDTYIQELKADAARIQMETAPCRKCCENMSAHTH